MDQKKVNRINELGRLMKQRELTPEEKEEQQLLRKEYLEDFRRALRGEKTK